MKEAAIAVVFSEDKVLMMKSSSLKIWLLPGGGIEENESASEACQREVLEETGYRVEVVRMVGIYKPINRITSKVTLFECRLLGSNQGSFCSEVIEVQWRPVSEARAMTIFPLHKNFITDAYANHKNVIDREQFECSYWHAILFSISHPIIAARYMKMKI